LSSRPRDEAGVSKPGGAGAVSIRSRWRSLLNRLLVPERVE
jgi:hypothetical protein